MEPFEDRVESRDEANIRRRRRAFIALAVLAAVALLALVVVLHLSGARPTHGG